MFYISDQTVVNYTDKSEMQQKVQTETCPASSVRFTKEEIFQLATHLQTSRAA